MSPRRKIDAAEADYFAVHQKSPTRWGLPMVAMLSTLLIAAAIAGSVFMLVRHVSDDRAQGNAAGALGAAREFVADYMTIDPYHANPYADNILNKWATGDFAKMFKERENEIVVQVARAEPTQGTVEDAGIQRWNDNGSADVLVAAKTSTRSPDGKSIIESGNRWVVTTIREGQQWKISQLNQVI